MRQRPEDPPDRPPLDLAALRARLAAQADTRPGRGALPFGIHDIDARLAGGGLALGQLHEVAPWRRATNRRPSASPWPWWRATSPACGARRSW